MRAGAAILLAAPFAVGCAPVRSAPTAFAASSAELRPEMSPGETATLRLGGEAKGAPAATEFAVEVVRTQAGSDTTLALRVGGEAIEREVYESSATAFRVIDVGDNAFVPGIDLVRYPAHGGDAWDWTGRVVYAGASRAAHAQVGLTLDGEELRSDVRLFVAADPGFPELERRLDFWFRKGHSVARRAFGGVSSRRPTGEAWRP